MKKGTVLLGCTFAISENATSYKRPHATTDPWCRYPVVQTCGPKLEGDPALMRLCRYVYYSLMWGLGISAVRPARTPGEVPEGCWRRYEDSEMIELFNASCPWSYFLSNAFRSRSSRSTTSAFIETLSACHSGVFKVRRHMHTHYILAYQIHYVPRTTAHHAQQNEQSALQEPVTYFVVTETGKGLRY